MNRIPQSLAPLHLPAPALPRGRTADVRRLEALATRYFWPCVALVLTLASWNALWRIGDTFVRDHDEARYGVAASEMLHAHSLLVTTYAGATEFWNLKPPLGYWLLELSYRVVGETPLGLRLPAALCAVLTTLLAMLLARRLGGNRAALLAGAILATSFGFFGHHSARSGDLDADLSLLLLTFLALAPALPRSRAARLCAGLVLGLAFLVKSFAILPFVAAIVGFYLLQRGARSWRIWPLPFAVLALIVATWALARTLAEGSTEFVSRMFTEDLLLRSTTMIDGGGSVDPWDYAGAVFDRIAPWPLLALLGYVWARRTLRGGPAEDGIRLLWAFALVPMILFTLARTHHSHYVVPTYPAWAILAALGASQLLRHASRLGLLAPATVLMGALLLACELRLVTHMQIHDRMPEPQHFLVSLRSPDRPAGLRLCTEFTPSYTERFFLQVVDGFELGADAGDRQCTGEWVLSRKSATEEGRSEAEAGAAAALLVAQDPTYRLLRYPRFSSR